VPLCAFAVCGAGRGCGGADARARCGAGLRALSRPQLDSFLALAECCVVAETHSDAFDAYVLSESSLFVYDTKLMIKTCGTTALLAALPRMLALAASVGAVPARCRYSRACFKYPKRQPAPHRSWDEECAYLDVHFAAPRRGSARVLGTPGKGLLWHVYCADAPGAPEAPAPAGQTLTLEVCMTQLDAPAARAFMFGDEQPLPPALRVTDATGIRAMFPAAVIDDFVFAPCGYSMNALQGPGLATIHVTPEARCSYASVEISGHAPGAHSPAALLRAAVGTFQPARISVAITCDAAGAGGKGVPPAWAKVPVAEGYHSQATARAELPGGGWVLHATMERVAAQPATP
jgi:S-adenosylmethionine decarboxylase